MMKDCVKLLTAAALAAGLLISFSCSKDKDSTSYNYLDGSITFTVPSFVAAGDVLDVTPKGISHPDGDPFGYYWTVSDLKEKRDTTKYLTDPEGASGCFTFTVPDTLGSFSITVTAFAPDYYPTSGSRSFIIVKPSESLSGTGIELDDFAITDGRDGQKYAFMQAGGLRWMRQNLVWNGAGTSFDFCPAADPVFGRFYSWTEAQTACPEGWRLPTDAEWAALVEAASGQTGLVAGETFPSGAGDLISGSATFNTWQLWEFWPEVTATDAVGFCALPFGYGNLANTGRGSFTGLYKYAAFWLADEAEGMGRYRYLNVRRPEVFVGSADKNLFAASVRCVAE